MGLREIYKDRLRTVKHKIDYVRAPDIAITLPNLSSWSIKGCDGIDFPVSTIINDFGRDASIVKSTIVKEMEEEFDDS